MPYNQSVARILSVAYNEIDGDAYRFDRVVWGGTQMAGVKGRSGRKPTWGDEQIEEAAESLLDWLEADPENHLWFKDWAIENNLPPEYLSRWSERNPIFRQAMGVAEMAQEARLVNGGLKNRLNARIVALVLESRHRWAGRQQLAVEMPAEQRMPSSIEEANKLIEAVSAHRDSLIGIVEQARVLGTAIVDG